MTTTYRSMRRCRNFGMHLLEDVVKGPYFTMFLMHCWVSILFSGMPVRRIKAKGGVTKLVEVKALVHSRANSGYSRFSEVTSGLSGLMGKTRPRPSHAGLGSFVDSPRISCLFEIGWEELIGTELKNISSGFCLITCGRLFVPAGSALV